MHISEEHQESAQLDGDNRIVCYTSHSKKRWLLERYDAFGLATGRYVYRQSHVLNQRCRLLDHLFDDPDQFLAKTLRLLFNGVSGT